MNENNSILSFDKDYRVFLTQLKEKVRKTQLKASITANTRDYISSFVFDNSTRICADLADLPAAGRLKNGFISPLARG